MNIILFDGECTLCNRTVRFTIRHDRAKLFHFASLQSTTGQKLLEQNGYHPESMETVVYIRSNKYYTRSTAILLILKDLGGIWRMGYVFIIIPPFIRNSIYTLFSRMRYKFFKRQISCEILPDRERERFLDH